MSRELTAFGRTLRERSRYEPLRQWVLGAATVFLALSVAMLVAVSVTYDGWSQRSSARSARDVEVHTGEPALLTWLVLYQQGLDGHPFTLVYLAPLQEDAPLPPGVDRWPGDREVVASPAMIGTPEVAADSELGRYGRTIGVISSAGLTEPQERLVYVGAESLPRGAGTPAIDASGFGSTWSLELGSIVNRQPASQLIAVLTVFVLLPASWLLVVAVRIGASQRARRVGLLRLLGARRRDVMHVLWGEARRPLIMGLGAAAGILGLTLAIDVPIPGVEFVLQARDMRSGLHLLIAAFGIAGLASVALVLSPLGLRRERRRPPPKAPKLIVGLASPAAAGGTLVAVNLTLAADAIDAVSVVFAVGSLTTLALLPTSARAWVALAAIRGRRKAWLMGDASRIVGNAQVAATPAPAARFGATLAILIVITSFSYSFAIAVAGVGEASEYEAAVGNDVIFVTPWRQVDPGRADAVRTMLNREFFVVAKSTEADDMTATQRLTGSEEALKRLGVEDQGSLPPWVDGFVDHTIVVIDDPPGDADSLVISPRRERVELQQLQDELARLTVPAWTAALPAQDLYASEARRVANAAWITLAGTAGILLALLALWSAYANELLRAVRSLHAIQLLAPSPRFVGRALLARVLTPVSVAVVGGCGLSVILILPLASGATYEIPLGFIMSLGLLCVSTGLLAWYITWRVCLHRARAMPPGIPEE